MAQEKHIGRLHGGLVRCLECLGETEDSKQPGTNENGAKLYIGNIMPYKQRCHNCDKVLSYGQTDAWCQLFPKPEHSVATIKGTLYL